MDNTNYNHSIKCSVTECTHHAQGDNYCALSQIMVGTHENDCKDANGTDCESFKSK